MSTTTKLGWDRLLDGYPWFAGPGAFPLFPYSEMLQPPRLGRGPYGASDRLMLNVSNPLAWPVTEIEEEYELRPGLEHVAQRILEALTHLNHGQPVPLLAGH